MVVILSTKRKANANAYSVFVDIAKKEDEKRYNFVTYNLPFTHKEIHKAFNEFFDRKYNEKRYGYAFIEKEAFKDENGKYLVNDPENYDGYNYCFVTDNIACIPDTVGGPHFFIMHWLERFDIKRDKSEK